jgi:predicted HTH transcriptional regulator
MEPGEKEARNPKIAAAFRRLALCEQAGTGLRMMKAQWVEQGHPEPEYVNDRGRKAFEFRLPLVEAKKDEKLRQNVKTDNKTAQVTARVTAQVTEQVTAQVTEQVTAQVTAQVTEQVKLLLKIVSTEPASVSELMENLQNFKRSQEVRPLYHNFQGASNFLHSSQNS